MQARVLSLSVVFALILSVIACDGTPVPVSSPSLTVTLGSAQDAVVAITGEPGRQYVLLASDEEAGTPDQYAGKPIGLSQASEVAQGELPASGRLTLTVSLLDRFVPPSKVFFQAITFTQAGLAAGRIEQSSVVWVELTAPTPTPTDTPTVTPTPTPAVASLKFLTQNTQLLPGEAPCYAGLCVDHAQRIPCIRDLIAGYDVVGLQEVWDESSQTVLVSSWPGARQALIKIAAGDAVLSHKREVATTGNLLNATQPARIIDARPNSIPAHIVYDRYFVLGPDTTGSARQDGGLLILSNLAQKGYPIIAASGFVYSRSAPGSLDVLANKGAIYARIQVGETPADYIHVFNTHTQAQDYPAERYLQITELYAFIENATSDRWSSPPGRGVYDGHPIVVMGDFNVIAGTPGAGTDEYRNLLLALVPLRDARSNIVRLADAWAAIRPSDPGYTWSARGLGKDPKGPWWRLGNVLASGWESGDPQRLDYIFYVGGTSGLALQPTSIRLVPSGPNTLYCFDDKGESWWGCTSVPVSESTLTVGKTYGFVIDHTLVGTLQCDGTVVGNKGDGVARAGSYAVIVPGTQEGDVVWGKVTALYTGCAVAEAVEILKPLGKVCRLGSHTVSDHLGVEMSARIGPAAALAPTPTATPVSAPAATPTATSSSTPAPAGVAGSYRMSIIQLMRATNARQKAAGLQQTDWGLGCAPDGGVECPALEALDGVRDEDLPRYVQALQNAVGGAIPSERFWNPDTAEPFRPGELFPTTFPGHSSWPSAPEAGNLEEIRQVLERLDTVVIAARFPPSILGKVTPSGLPGETTFEAHWAIIEDSEPRAIAMPAPSRYLENFKRFWHITRAFLCFDTSALEGSPIESAFLQVMYTQVLAQDRPADDPRAPMIQERAPLAIELYSGTWDPLTKAGTGFGLGGADWLSPEEAARDWESCPTGEGQITMAHTGVDAPGRAQSEVSAASINTQGWTQFRLKLADESYPGDPGRPNLRQDSCFLSGNHLEHRLVIRVGFATLPAMPTSFR
ncbi:MAG: endonuclease/exonuclease/phosphatase family protein [Anaerolineae bacterium]|nr:endonuclease/exonuclease/phosphatase family protein [Anaerolineae bacterium]